MPDIFQFTVATSNTKLAYSNRVYVSKSSFSKIANSAISLGVSISSNDPIVNLSIGHLVFAACANADVGESEIALNIKQRTAGSFTLSQVVNATVFVPSTKVALSSMTVLVDLLGKKDTKMEIDAEEVSKSFKDQFSGQVYTLRQPLVMDFNGLKLDLAIDSFDHANITDEKTISPLGQVLSVTTILFKKNSNSTNKISIKGGAISTEMKNDLFKGGFNFESLGIGGLDEQFKKMFRTAFASRLFPGIVKQLGINHVRGILLYGPPGCGKTLIARQIGKVLNAREPKIVNGPEILDKYVGGSEEKIRELFADAEKEQAEAGDASMLHIIIFDEMDAIMKARGSSRDSTGVNDSVVNQLLSKIDGVDSLNNILIIGMTNRKDLIDEAILRPGRLEVHIEVTLPDEHGRIQILNIKTQDMRKSKRITEDALNRLPELAHLTKNFTGAELEGLVRNSASFALARNIDAVSMKTVDEKNMNVAVEWRDFERALSETTPAFGNKDNHEISLCFNNGMINFGINFEETWTTMQRLTMQSKNSTRTPLLTVLLEGPVSSGKTAIAAKIAITSDFPFIRMITPDSMIGYSDSQKCQTLLKTFTDAYKSPYSIIVIDDIERIMEYTPVGHRFSNSILQTLLILIKKIPPSNCNLFIIATTSIANLMEDVQVTQAFNIVLHVNELESPSDIYKFLVEYPNIGDGSLLPIPEDDMRKISNSISKPIGVKQLLMVLEMARLEETNKISADNFLECLHTIGY